jgi:hypothetical protein
VKSARLDRFHLVGRDFFKSPGSSHPRTEPICKFPGTVDFSGLTAFNKNLLFLSLFYTRLSSLEGNPDHFFLEKSKDSVAKGLSSDHPALSMVRVHKRCDYFKDVDRSVLFGQLTAMLLAGSPVVVPDIRKVTHAMYRTKVIPELETNVSLHGYKAVKAFIDKGALHLLVASRIFRNSDLSNPNIGRSRGNIVAFDFDQNGVLNLEAASQGSFWGFSARGVDRAGWIPPLDKPKAPYVYGEGPVMWPDRSRDGFSLSYHAAQLFWRELYSHREAVHIQHRLYLQFLSVSPEWLKVIQLSFLGEHAVAENLYLRVLRMRSDVQLALLSSAIFRLDLFLNEGRYLREIQDNFDTYNLTRCKGKPKNDPYRLRFDPGAFQKLKFLFLRPSAEEFKDHNEEQKFAYLQFLVLLQSCNLSVDEFESESESIPGSIPGSYRATRDSTDGPADSYGAGSSPLDGAFPVLRSEEKTATKLNVLSRFLTEEDQIKLRLFAFLFSGLKDREERPSYRELFFLCKTFDLLYPTFQREEEKGLFNRGFSRFDIRPDNLGDSRVSVYFPHDVQWAFSNFSYSNLTSSDAEKKFKLKFVDADQIGRETRSEAFQDFAALISSEKSLSPFMGS